MNEAKDIGCDLFLLGQRDCMEGVPHRSGMGESYDRGYDTQYRWEQVKNAETDDEQRKQSAG